MSHDRAHFAALVCTPGITWTKDIQQMFTQLDIEHMKAVAGLDLGDYNTVKIHAVQIYGRVKSHSMPPPGSGEAWSDAWGNTFGCWIQQGSPQ